MLLMRSATGLLARLLIFGICVGFMILPLLILSIRHRS